MIGVLNAGTHPEPMYLAAELARRGHVIQYLTASSLAADHVVARLAASPLLASTAIGRNVSRRVMPVLDRRQVRYSAVGRELLFQVAAKRSPQHAARLLEARTEQFRRSSARRLASRTDLECIVAEYTSGLGAFEQADPSVRRVLSYPIAHHRWMRDHMASEGSSNPRWAPFLQGHDNDPRFDEMLDREIALADLVVVPSTFVRETFEYAGVTGKVVPVSLGVDPRVLHAGRNDAIPTTNSSFTVLFAGQINQRKGISYLLDGFAAADIPGATLRLVGPAADGILPLVREYPNVEVVPSLPRSELAGEYSSADVLVLPSLAEGFGLVVIEAMSRGTPAVVTAWTLAGDVITDGSDGMVIEAASAPAITAALERLAGDRAALADMSRAARVTAARFDWQRFAAGAADAVETVMG